MSILEEKLKPLITSIHNSLNHENYHAALALSLTLPDICSSISNNNKTTRKVYQAFIDNYFFPLHNYDSRFISSIDIYALRCVYLHNGMDDLTNYDKETLLDDYSFFIPKKIIPRIRILHSGSASI